MTTTLWQTKYRGNLSFEQAAKRQGLMAGGFLAIGETVTPKHWSAAAKSQQAELTCDG